jgi:hypothetical protein
VDSRRGVDTPARLCLTAVEQSLRSVQETFAADASELAVRRDRLDEHVIANMLAGYARVEALVADGIDVFAMGQLKQLLELNALVLCGSDEDRRDDYARHLSATERRFYDLRGGGIRDVVEWLGAHRGDPPRERAAGLYVRILCHPQLFIEGNHRTGALLMSYVLLRDGEAPFVLAPDNAAEYFAVSTALRSTDRRGPVALLRLPGLRQRVLALISQHADARYLQR